MLTDAFEAHAQQAENGIEFWLAGDLQHLLGYDGWRNFTAVSTRNKNHVLTDEVDDIMLTRYPVVSMETLRISRAMKAAAR